MFTTHIAIKRFRLHAHSQRIFRASILILMGLLLAWLAAACSSDSSVSVAPAAGSPTFVWIFSDPWPQWEQMRPVVDGLEEEYGERIEFRIHNISSPEGKSWANQYNLRGHPAFLLLDSQGQEQWRYIGTISREGIVAEFEGFQP